ncbi:hypothetical protein B0A50_07879 [Salinomyces thailandicus]|uniref:DUF7728 domain-containing protein n=1 Tax=Salinomyces thailandicus TaxID=706561 RepID=A0A4U0TLR1_9PEZI|nr:hypothetical protein B0A50_07879 [Salinomyces thailandica]
MLGRSVGITAACVLGASAFIIPQGIAPASLDKVPDELAATVINPKNQNLILPCSDCVFPTKSQTENVEDEDGTFWIQGGANSLVLNFTVSDDGQRLQLNGGDIYPPHFQQDGWFEQQPVYVKQVPAQAGLADVKSGAIKSTDLEVTAYGIKEGDKQALPLGDMVVPLKFEIFGLENQFIRGVDEVALSLLKLDGGELLIMEASRVVDGKSHPDNTDSFPVPPPPPPHLGDEDFDFFSPPPPPAPFRASPHNGPNAFKPKECNMLPQSLCKLAAMVESKIDAMMPQGPPSRFRKGGCHGRKGPHTKKLPGHIRPHFVRPGFEDHEDGMRPHHGRPHHMRPHGKHHGPHAHYAHPHGHGHGHFRAQFLHAFAKGLVALLIPVMAGITVGMFVSLVGLVFGRLIAYLWIRLARGGRRGSASASLQAIVLEEGEAEDKSLIAEMDAEALPRYEDAPAYEEVVTDEKEAK